MALFNFDLDLVNANTTLALLSNKLLVVYPGHKHLFLSVTKFDIARFKERSTKELNPLRGCSV